MTCESLTNFLKKTPQEQRLGLRLERTHEVRGPTTEGSTTVQTFYNIVGLDQCVYTEHEEVSCDIPENCRFGDKNCKKN